MNQSLTAKKIPIKRGRKTAFSSKTMNQNDISYKSQPTAIFGTSLALNYLSTVSPRTTSMGFNNFRKKKISRISNLATPRQITTPLSTRFASSQTRKLLEFYSILKQNYHDFTFDVPEKLFDCEFSRQFTRFTTRFDYFSRLIACLYGTVNPKSVIKNSSPMITSSLHQATKSLMTEWIDFIERLNNISEDGISPHISMTNSNLTILFQNLATISTIILVDKFKGDVAGHIVKSICALCLRIKDSLVEEYSKLKSERFINFDYDSFEEHCRKCSQLTASLFEQNLPPNSFTLTEMLSIKSGIINTISIISQILRSAMHFEERIMNLKKSIISFNKELNNVEMNANLPFCIELSLDEPAQDMLGDFESLENEVKKNEEDTEKKISDDHSQDASEKDSIEEDFFETEKKDENQEDNEVDNQEQNVLIEEEEEVDLESNADVSQNDNNDTENVNNQEENNKEENNKEENNQEENNKEENNQEENNQKENNQEKSKQEENNQEENSKAENEEH